MDYQNLETGITPSVYLKSKHRKNISRLLKNQPKLGEYGNPHKDSNCYGTVVELLNKRERVKKLWQDAGNKLDDTRDYTGNYIVDHNDKPLYMGDEVFKLLLENDFREYSRPENNSIVTFSWSQPNSEFYGYSLKHAGIIISYSKENNDRWVFSQNNLGGEFGFFLLNEYKNYIISRDRDKKVRDQVEKSFNIEYWRNN